MNAEASIFEPILTSREKQEMREQLFRHREFARSPSYRIASARESITGASSGA